MRSAARPPVVVPGRRRAGGPRLREEGPAARAARPRARARDGRRGPPDRRRRGDHVHHPVGQHRREQPADIARVEVYAYTAMAQNDVRDTKRMTLVGTIPVRKPPEPEPEGAKKKPGRSAASRAWREPGRRRHGHRDADGRDAGAARPRREACAWSRRPRRSRGSTRRWCRRSPARSRQTEPRRFYVVYGVSRGGRPRRRVAAAGRAARRAARAAASAAPRDHGARHRRRAGTRRQGRACPTRSRPKKACSARRSGAWNRRPRWPTSCTAGRPRRARPGSRRSPSTARTFTDPDVEFGVERCYDVRTVEDPGPVDARERAVAGGLHHAGRRVPAAGAGRAGRGGGRRGDQPDLEGRGRVRPRRLHRAARRGGGRRLDAALRRAAARDARTGTRRRSPACGTSTPSSRSTAPRRRTGARCRTRSKRRRGRGK